MNNQDAGANNACNYHAETKKPLRQQAETKAGQLIDLPPEHLGLQETRQLVHELQVHQIELAAQNDELQSIQLELQDSRDRFIALYDYAPVGYISLSEKGLIIHTNLTMSSLLSVSRGLLAKQPLSRFILNEDQDIYYQHCEQLLKTGTAKTSELRMIRPDGSTFWALLQTALDEEKKTIFSGQQMPVESLLDLFDPKEEHLILASVVDITERKNLETEAHRLASIVKSSSDAILSKSMDGLVQSWNSSAERLFGFRAEEIIGQPVAKIIPSELLDEESEIVDKLKQDELFTNYETKRRKKNGQLIDVSLTISPVHDNNGKIIGASTIIRDISSRKEAEARQTLLMTALEQSSESIVITNAEGTIEYVNPAF